MCATIMASEEIKSTFELMKILQMTTACALKRNVVKTIYVLDDEPNQKLANSNFNGRETTLHQGRKFLRSMQLQNLEKAFCKNSETWLFQNIIRVYEI